MAATGEIEVFFDCSSPWTYLAFENVQLLAAELGARIIWRPILVGGVFNTVNPTVYESRANPAPAKARYMLKDLQDWAGQTGLKIKMPPSVFPVNSVKAMRVCVALASDDRLIAFARAVFRAYWGEDQDISRDDVLETVCRHAGLGADILARAADPAVKAELRANTDELIARGGFGSPTLFLAGDDMYFGNDRLALVRAALMRQRA